MDMAMGFRVAGLALAIGLAWLAVDAVRNVDMPWETIASKPAPNFVR